MREQKELTKKFITTFQKAVSMEMDALKKSKGPFEIILTMEKLEEEGDDYVLYSWLPSVRENLPAPGAECALRRGDEEYSVSTERSDGGRIFLKLQTPLPGSADRAVLVIYPWFIYEKLLIALEDLPVSTDYHLESGLRLFGKAPVTVTTENPADIPEDSAWSTLNDRQSLAVQTCLNSSAAYIWGPPGTGKTTTLVALTEQLLRDGKSVLVTSNTNAALDQVIEGMFASGRFGTPLREGKIIRAGMCREDQKEVSVEAVALRMGQKELQRLNKTRAAGRVLREKIEMSQKIVQELQEDHDSGQFSLFDDEPRDSLTNLLPLLSKKEHSGLQRVSRAEREKTLTALLQTWSHKEAETVKKAAAIQGRLMRYKTVVVENARILFSTMAHLYLSPVTRSRRYDTVIVEEAGMAILPALFYSACLAKEKTIAVGDPQQLPPVMQSRDPYAVRAMSRNIFGIAHTANESCLVQLTTQYRMHPDIGTMVSRLYYNGTLVNGKTADLFTDSLALTPWPENAVVVVDTSGKSGCRRDDSSFSRMNDYHAALAARIADACAGRGLQALAIITPYARQAELIRKQLGPDTAAHTRCSTVHRFQGQEEEMIILDTVDAAPFSPGILISGSQSHADNLLNVSISRAKASLVLIADLDYFKKHDNGKGIHRVLDYAGKNGIIVPAESLRSAL